MGSVAGSQEPIFSLRTRREGVEKHDGSRIGCGVAPNWNLPESGGGRQCLFSRPVPLGHMLSVVFPGSAAGTSLKHQHPRGTFPVSGLLRRDGRKSEPCPPPTCSCRSLHLLMDDKIVRICSLSAKSDRPPASARASAGDSRTRREWRCPRWSWKRRPTVEGARPEAPTASACGRRTLKPGHPPFPLPGGGAWKVGGESAGTRRYQAPGTPWDTTITFHPYVVAVGGARALKTELPTSRKLQAKGWRGGERERDL